MICPLCETANDPGAAECAGCGKALAKVPEGAQAIDPGGVPGLEPTVLDARELEAAPVETLPELEQTLLARRDLRIAEERVPGIEATQVEDDPFAPTFWSDEATETETGREVAPERTAAPQDDGTCPWCRAPSSGAICDSCGRRRARYTAARERDPNSASAAEETRLCPACFARVPDGPRCVECGVRFPVTDLY